jgi:hypothetical protein
MTKTLYVSYGLCPITSEKIGGFPDRVIQQTPPTRASSLLKFARFFSVHQTQQRLLYPGFFKTPQIAVGPHDIQ